MEMGHLYCFRRVITTPLAGSFKFVRMSKALKASHDDSLTDRKEILPLLIYVDVKISQSLVKKSRVSKNVVMFRRTVHRESGPI